LQIAIFSVSVAYHYGSQSQNQQQILKYLSSSYIANKVTVYEQASNEDLCIHISEDMYLPLATADVNAYVNEYIQ
jgi:hypothetical protein